MVFASDGQQYAKAIGAVVPADAELVFTRNPTPGRKSISFDHLAATVPTDAVEDAHEKVGPDTIAKFLFTSLDRDAEGRNQYPAHVVFEPDHGALGAPVSARRAADDPRLGAMASHRRRQS